MAKQHIHSQNIYGLGRELVTASPHPHLTAILQRKSASTCLYLVPLTFGTLLLTLQDPSLFKVHISVPVTSEVSGCQGLMGKRFDNIRSIIGPI